MKKIKLFPCPHVELKVHVSDEMEADLKECYRKSCTGEAVDCEGCSWDGLEIYGSGLCELTELVNKVLGKDRRR